MLLLESGGKKLGVAGCRSWAGPPLVLLLDRNRAALPVAAMPVDSDQEASSDARISAQRPKAKAALLKPA